jgi:ATP-dependent DNA helicase HFM1/MER3
MVGHKISLLIQSALCGIDLPVPSDAKQLHMQYQQDQMVVWQAIKRLVRCIIDFSIHREDSIVAQNSLMLFRSVSAMGWDDSPMQMKQIENIGIASIRKLSGAGITSIEILEETEPHKIESALKKAPPYGRKLLEILKGFPKLRVSITMMGRLVRGQAFV